MVFFKLSLRRQSSATEPASKASWCDSTAQKPCYHVLKMFGRLRRSRCVRSASLCEMEPEEKDSSTKTLKKCASESAAYGWTTIPDLDKFADAVGDSSENAKAVRRQHPCLNCSHLFFERPTRPEYCSLDCQTSHQYKTQMRMLIETQIPWIVDGSAISTISYL